MSEANPLAYGLFQPFRTLGIHTFRFALFPEGEAMVAFNRSEEAHVTDFTSPAVWATGSSLAVLEEYLGKIHPDDAPGMVAFVEKHLGTAASGSVGQSPVYYAAHQFQAAMDVVDFRWYELRTQLSLDASGALVIVEGCFLDISALKERELELEEKTVALEREVAGHLRTQASLEQALAELKSAQQRLLEQARLKALGEMVSGVAHDFGNLLGPIQMAAELIGEEVEGPATGVIDRDEVGALAADVAMAAKDGAELIATLRAAYLPEGAAGPERGPIRLVPLLEGVRRLARSRHEGMEGRVQIEVHPTEEAVVQGSESLLRHALLNLVFNAIDASVDKESSEVMTVRLDLGHGPEGVSIRVRDEGIGMTAEQLARCTERFYSSKGERGTGLGLANTVATVREMGGEVTLASTPGQGTTVTVSLPPA